MSQFLNDIKWKWEMEHSFSAEKFEEMFRRLEKGEQLQAMIDALIRVKQCADGGTELVSNQGQGMDGYSELANYRAIIKKFIEGGD